MKAKGVEELATLLETQQPEVLSRLRHILRDHPILKQIPITQQICKDMKITHIPAHENFLVDSSNLYLLLFGFLTKESTPIQPFSIFGYTQALDGKQWLPARITAHSASSLLAIPKHTVKQMAEKRGLFNFLSTKIPNFSQYVRSSKERILNLFERRRFKAGDYLLKEGKIASYAYIIEEGQCKLLSSESPLADQSYAQHFRPSAARSYTFGVVGTGEWVGENSILQDIPSPYTVRAQGIVKTLMITKENFLNGLDNEILNLLRKNAETKTRWISQRRGNIQHTMSKSFTAQKIPEDIPRMIYTRSTCKQNEKKTVFRTVSTNHLAFRPGTSYMNRIKQLCKNNTNKQGIQVELHSASTFGYTLIPKISRKTIK